MRLRLLPLLMFALVGTTTVKLGSVWNAFEISVGTETMAQTEAAQTEPAQSQSEPVQVEPVQAEPIQPTQPQETASVPADAAGPEQASAAGAEIGLQEPLVDDPFDYTDEEVDVLQQLAKRREELELRARQLDEREALIQAAEQRMDQKMAELKALQGMVEDLLKKRSDEEEAELMSLVKMYENMKPKDAAQVFEEMDMDVLLDVVGRMNERKAAPILALVTPTRAKEITFELASRKELPLPQ